MIKKLNVLLLVAVVSLCALKVVSKASAKAKRAPETARAPAVVRNAEFAPVVHYIPMTGFAMVNEHTQRNGYQLDCVRAVFPKATFVAMAPDTLKADGKGAAIWGIENALMSGPESMTMVSKGAAEMLRVPYARNFGLSIKLYAYTLRDRGLKCDGVDSLKTMKLGTRSGMQSIPEVKQFLGAYADNLRFYKTGEPGYANPMRALTTGEVDAYLLLRSPSAGGHAPGLRPDQLMVCRISEPLLEVSCVIGVSNLDPARAKKLVAAFEKGIDEIEKSGELRRIREYYAH